MRKGWSGRLLSGHVAAWLVVLALACALPARSDGGDGFFGRILEARELHDRGVEGDKEAVVGAIALLEEKLAQEPGDQLARVYLGSALTLRSRDLPPGPDKLGELIKGVRLMDEAVEAAPGDIRVRFVRAVNHYNLPALFGKRKLARRELLAVREALADSRQKLAPCEEQAMRYYAGRALEDMRRKAEAAAEIQSALALAPDSPLAPEIRRRLDAPDDRNR